MISQSSRSWCSDIISAEGAPLEPFCGLHEDTSLGLTCMIRLKARNREAASLLKFYSGLSARLLLPQAPVTTDVAAPALGLCSQPLPFSALQ